MAVDHLCAQRWKPSVFHSRSEVAIRRALGFQADADREQDIVWIFDASESGTFAAVNILTEIPQVETDIVNFYCEFCPWQVLSRHWGRKGNTSMPANDEKTALKAASKALARKYLSPLRYPGGKRKLVTYVAAALDRNGTPEIDRIIEPFTGGAAMSISLIEAGIARQAILNDLDPLVSSFWKVVFSDRHFELADRILDAKVTLSEWEKQRDANPASIVDKAFKCIFLNRTSFSGALNPSAGPLGGKAQKSANPIDCRWNANELAERIWGLGRLSGRVRVHNKDFRRLVGSYRSAHTRNPEMLALWYFDPPFFHKANKLYRYWFEDEDHRALARCLKRLNEPWILSYDSCPEARQMYRDHAGRGAVDMRYTAAKAMKVQKMEYTEMIVENFNLRKRRAALDVHGSIPTLKAESIR